MITWVQQHYPDYYSQGVIELTVEQKSDKRRYQNCTYDFLYETINVKITKAFLATKKHPTKLTRDEKGLITLFLIWGNFTMPSFFVLTEQRNHFYQYVKLK